MSGKVSSTIGFERRFNWALQAPDRATFAAWVSGTPRAAVADVLRHRQMNQGLLPLPEGYGRPAKGAAPALGSGELLEAVAAGATPLDVRPRDDFAAGHLAGALAAPYSRDALAARVAALCAPGEPVVVVAENGAVAGAAAELLAAAGRNPVRGYLAAPAAALEGPEGCAERLAQIGVDELARRAAAGDARILDVREPHEWVGGVIAGAALISWCALRERLGELPRGRPVVVVCESGTRATVAASLLLRHGIGPVAVVAPEGMSDYAACHPTVRPA